MGMDWDEVGMLKNDCWRDSIAIFLHIFAITGVL